MATIPVILLPGLLCDARLWRDQAGALAAYVPDLTQDDTIEAMARRVLEHAPARFGLAGLSMGGYVALAIMALAPDRVERLCLMDTSAHADTHQQARRRRGIIALVTQEPAHRFKGVTPRLLPQLVHPDRAGDTALAEEIAAMAARVGRDGFLRQQHAILHRPDRRALLPRLNLPVLVAVGEADQVTPPELAIEMANSITGSQLEVIRNSGHLPPIEQPEAVSAMLQKWFS